MVVGGEEGGGGKGGGDGEGGQGDGGSDGSGGEAPVARVAQGWRRERRRAPELEVVRGGDGEGRAGTVTLPGMAASRSSMHLPSSTMTLFASRTCRGKVGKA